MHNIEALEGFLGIQGYWPKKLKGIRDISVNIYIGIRDTWINFRDMGIQCFLNFGDTCHIYFRDVGYFFQITKKMWDTWTPSRASIFITQVCKCVMGATCAPMIV